MHFSKFKFIFLTSIITSCSFSEKSKDQILQTIIKDSLKVKKEFNKIIVLTENECSSCNSSYSKFLENQIKSNALFIVGATGAEFDITYLDAVNKNNIVYDYSNLLEKNGLLQNSGFILLKENKIDTIISLEAGNLDKQINYIRHELDDK
ncbi:hypothetical protein [Flavobacterium sp. H122]|uniref:hypothetical protein n=1 Tax=Flavobacterium sp. H122 TaxID=2529860 RepID=UPI0010AA867D|nr:hypothetical protein [Flavobacterium sp. H122]